MLAGPTRVPAALGAYLAPAAGLQAATGWAAASLDVPAADRSVNAEFVLAGSAGGRAVTLHGFLAKVTAMLSCFGICNSHDLVP